MAFFSHLLLNFRLSRQISLQNSPLSTYFLYKIRYNNISRLPRPPATSHDPPAQNLWRVATPNHPGLTPMERWKYSHLFAIRPSCDFHAAGGLKCGCSVKEGLPLVTHIYLFWSFWKYPGLAYLFPAGTFFHGGQGC